MLKKLVILFILILAILFLYINRQPDEFLVSRSIQIKATPKQVYQRVNDLRKWSEWSPWVKMHPDLKPTFEGPATGVSSKMKWSGDSNVGEGSMTIVRSQPYDVIGIRLEFVKPFESTNHAQFSFTPKEDGTEVTWQMSGKHRMVGKAASLVFDLDQLIGEQFEQGLADLRTVIEKDSASNNSAPAAPADP